ncbi:GtrA family protein [Prosthecochloris ethylica]|nr:GtrA family protein [Prosthecochloris ethylica]
MCEQCPEKMGGSGGEIIRYVFNGGVATLVHVGVLVFSMELLHIPYAGLANFIAALAGISVSFTGCRFFVFRQHDAPVFHQGVRFLVLYACMALLHGLVLYLLSDLLSIGYLYGFVVASVFQFLLSFFGNKKFVFT